HLVAGLGPSRRRALAALFQQRGEHVLYRRVRRAAERLRRLEAQRGIGRGELELGGGVQQHRAHRVVLLGFERARQRRQQRRAGVLAQGVGRGQALRRLRRGQRERGPGGGDRTAQAVIHRDAAGGLAVGGERLA